MSLSRLRYELRAIGPLNLAVPLLVTMVYLGFTVLVYYATLRNGGTPDFAHFQASRGLIGLLENGLPLAAGLVVTATVGQDPALELHLSLVRPYRGTAALRLALATLWSLAVTLVVSALTVATGYWNRDVLQPLPEGPLVWLSPLLLFIALGAVLALALRSRVASSAVLGMFWIAQFLFKPLFLQSSLLQKVYAFLTEEDGVPAYWLTNRLVLLAVALVCASALLYLLRRNEALLGSEP
jgi:hypothetical protein